MLDDETFERLLASSKQLDPALFQRLQEQQATLSRQGNPLSLLDVALRAQALSPALGAQFLAVGGEGMSDETFAHVAAQASFGSEAFEQLATMQAEVAVDGVGLFDFARATGALSAQQAYEFLQFAKAIQGTPSTSDPEETDDDERPRAPSRRSTRASGRRKASASGRRKVSASGRGKASASGRRASASGRRKASASGRRPSASGRIRSAGRSAKPRPSGPPTGLIAGGVVALLVVGGLLAYGLGSQSGPSVSWRTYTNQEYGYSLDLFAVPSEQSTRQETSDGPIVINTQLAKSAQDLICVASAFRLPDQLDVSDPNEHLEGGVEGLFTGMPQFHVRSKNVTNLPPLNGATGLEVNATGETNGVNTVVRSRIYMVGHVVYQVILAGKEDAYRDFDTHRLFDSFRIGK